MPRGAGQSDDFRLRNDAAFTSVLSRVKHWNLYRCGPWKLQLKMFLGSRVNAKSELSCRGYLGQWALSK